MNYTQAIQSLSSRYRKILKQEQDAKRASAESYSNQLTRLAISYKAARAKKPRAMTIPTIFG